MFSLPKIRSGLDSRRDVESSHHPGRCSPWQNGHMEGLIGTVRRECLRRWVERSNDTETLPLRPFCRGCITATRGYDFRKGQARGNSRPYRNPSPTVFLSTKPLHRPAAAPRPFGDLFEDEHAISLLKIVPNTSYSCSIRKCEIGLILIFCYRNQSRQPYEQQAIDIAEGYSLWRPAPEHIELMAKDHDLRLTSCAGPKQSDHGSAKQSEHINHQARASPNSGRFASCIEFPTGTRV